MAASVTMSERANTTSPNSTGSNISISPTGICVPRSDTTEGVLTLGQSEVVVDGVLSIGEHGKYPRNEKGQHLYPRRRFFEEITRTFEKYGKVVPVFSDKHLGPVWSDAKWMYDKARELKIPFMAGSSLPVTYRKPDFSLPMNVKIEEALAIGYANLDSYGFHTVDVLQAFVERRQGGETGVASVQCLQGDAMWRAVDEGQVSKDLLDAALAVVPRDSDRDVRIPRRSDCVISRTCDCGALRTSTFARPMSRFRNACCCAILPQVVFTCPIFGESYASCTTWLYAG